MDQSSNPSRKLPKQKQRKQPGIESEMVPPPKYKGEHLKHAEKLRGKVAIITGGDSGIGRAVAVAFAKEGADVCIPYLNENSDAEETKNVIEGVGMRCVLINTDISKEDNCISVVERTISELGKIDILINNAGKQFPQKNLEDISADQLKETFETNIFSHFFMVKAALKYLKDGAVIINTTSVTAFSGNGGLMDYAASKGAVVSFTRSLSANLVSRKIRVNGVAPGPVWTPLIPASFSAEEIERFGSNVPMGRPGQPEEIAPAYVFLASDDSSYMTGQILHPNGGEIVGS